MLSRAGLEALDRRLASLSRVERALRLRLGQALEALGRADVCASRGYAELGFPALAAYVRERVERSPRWAEAARCMARRLERLPRMRGAVARGVLSWSMAEQVARIATPEDEANWRARAERMTVRCWAP